MMEEIKYDQSPWIEIPCYNLRVKQFLNTETGETVYARPACCHCQDIVIAEDDSGGKE